MSRPLASDLHVDSLLTNIMEKFLQDQSKFIAGQVFPMVSVKKQSDLYPVYDRKFFWYDVMQKRGLSSESEGVRYEVGTKNYYCEIWASHKDVDDRERANADTPFDIDRDVTQLLSQQALIRIEREWASKYFKTGVWGRDFTGKSTNPDSSKDEFLQWDANNSAPIDMMLELADEMESTTGYRPNKLVLGPAVHRKLRTHPQFTDLFKYTKGGVLDTRTLADVFEVEKYLVPRAIYTSSADGASDTTYSRIVGERDALLVFSPNAPSTMTPSAGYIMVWSGYTKANKLGARISKFRMEHLKSDRIEAEMAFDMHKSAADLGIFLKDVVSDPSAE